MSNPFPLFTSLDGRRTTRTCRCINSGWLTKPLINNKHGIDSQKNKKKKKRRRNLGLVNEKLLGTDGHRKIVFSFDYFVKHNSDIQGLILFMSLPNPTKGLFKEFEV